MYAEVRSYMDNLALETTAEQIAVDKGHGKIEMRRYWQTSDIKWFSDRNLWKGLKNFCLVESVCEFGDKIETCRRYYISSHEMNIIKVSEVI